jgi:hypothetical protein
MVLVAERDALRAMMSEILALEDVETPSKDGSENVASVVGDALEHLRRERDEAQGRLAALYQDAAERIAALVAEQIENRHSNAEWQIPITLASERRRVYARCAEIARETEPLCEHCQEAAAAIEAEAEKEE